MSPDSEDTPADVLLGLINKTQGGDMLAFSELFKYTIAEIRARARAIVRNDFDADDVVAAVYERVLIQAATYDPARGCVRAWLMVMCRSRAVDMLRQGRHAPSSEWKAMGDRDDVISSAEDSFYSQWHILSLPQQLAALSAVRREVIVLAYFRGLSHIQIAAALGLPLGTVKSHLRRALRELRRIISADEAKFRDGIGNLPAGRPAKARPEPPGTAHVEPLNRGRSA